MPFVVAGAFLVLVGLALLFGAVAGFVPGGLWLSLLGFVATLAGAALGFFGMARHLQRKK
jgi:hypothetical protein